MSLSLGTNVISTSNALQSLPVETITESVTSSVTTNVLETIEPDNLVHKTGDETINGTKTFTNNCVVNMNNPYVIYKSNLGNYEVTSPDTDENVGNTIIQDSDGNWLGCFEVYAKSDGYTEIRMNAQKNGVWSAAPLGLMNNGTTCYAYCPTPSDASDNSTKIATTAWVNSRINAIMNSRMWLATPDFTNEVQICGEGGYISSYTCPSNGVVIGNLDASASASVTVNGKIAAKGGNDSGNEGPFYFGVVSGDVVNCTITVRGAYFVPYKYVSVSL